MSSENLPKFQCEICCKSYKKKDSLTRHSHNHQDSQRHTCLQCGHISGRRDTLQKHLDLHHKGRTRAVRACERCKAAKVKCDSRTPCAPCVRAHQDCTYNTPASYTNGRTNKNLVSASTLSKLPTQQSTNTDQHGGTSSHLGAPLPRSRTPPATTDQNQASMANEFAMLDQAQLSVPESDTINITMTDTVIPPLWDQGGPLPWSSADLFLDDNFMVNTDLYAENPLLLNGTANAIFGFDDNSNGRGKSWSEVNGPLSDNLPADSNNSVTFGTGFSNFNMGPLAHTTIIPPNGSHASHVDRQPGVQELDVLYANHILKDIVQDMVQFAIQNIAVPAPLPTHLQETSRELSGRIKAALPEVEAILSRSSSSHILHHFCDQFMAHFNPLWPLIRPNGLDIQSIPFILCLTIASIGAMYSGARCSQLGLMIHENLRLALLTTPFLHQQSAPSLECLQSLLLTEISALYFGPRSSLPIAQRIGAMIVQQARTMGIFSGRAFSGYKNVVPTLEQWSHREATIRFAFGSFRAEMFVSALLNVRPLLSAEEINLDLPCLDELWMGSIEDQRASLKASGDSSLTYADLVRIAKERFEIMPDLGAAQRDLVLYGIQESIWRFSQDPELFSRMMGKANTDPSSILDDGTNGELFNHPTRRQSWGRASEDWIPVTSPGSPIDMPMQDHLDCSSRKMADLRLDYVRMMMFLRKWKSSYVGNQSSSQLEGNRYNLLNSRLLYHLSFLRLRADLHTLDFLTTEHDDFQYDQQEDAVRRVWEWSKTISAEKALQHSCAIWDLVSSESTWRVGSRARFNIACLIALHCASKVVWAYAGAHKNPKRGILKIAPASTELLGADLLIFRENSHALMECFERLFHVITKGWMSWFPKVVTHMADSPLPLPYASSEANSIGAEDS
jgi:Fungal specific transcription factor domain/Fungal Zn(2)-Cys(6) binuclear cluster domain